MELKRWSEELINILKVGSGVFKDFRSANLFQTLDWLRTLTEKIPCG